MTPCKHCGSSDRDRQCRFYWWLPFADQIKRQGWDKPCTIDRAEEESFIDWKRRRLVAAERRRSWLWVLTTIALAAAFLAWRQLR